MKLSNIFKKETKVKSNVQTLDKKKLAKVIGGTDGTTLEETTEAAAKTRAKIYVDRDMG